MVLARLGIEWINIMLIISENTRDTLQYLHLFPQKMNQFLTFLAKLQGETVEAEFVHAS